MSAFCLSSGVGCDAKVAYDFHMSREERPDKFSSQVILAPSILDDTELDKNVIFQNSFQ